ncbi:MAG: hypothetical protein DWQ31_15730 [Planctomycetota bacterium]|nr:MAG: hypothetical protein DWQ31_15730 [Planctomycetota bacterium]REJ97391.1 MAG: hypothetical protein DWQ35_02205 [Planctomycetota bacterium]
MDVEQLAQKLGACGSLDRAEAAQQLCQAAEAARPAAVALVRAAGDEDESVQEWATAALEELGPPAEDDLSALAELTADANADIAYWAITLIGRLEGAGAGATGELAAALAAERPLNVRQRAAWALGRIGPGAVEATGPLTAAAADDDPRLARLASEALAALGVA